MPIGQLQDPADVPRLKAQLELFHLGFSLVEVQAKTRELVDAAREAPQVLGELEALHLRRRECRANDVGVGKTENGGRDD